MTFVPLFASFTRFSLSQANGSLRGWTVVCLFFCNNCYMIQHDCDSSMPRVKPGASFYFTESKKTFVDTDQAAALEAFRYFLTSRASTPTRARARTAETAQTATCQVGVVRTTSVA